MENNELVILTKSEIINSNYEDFKGQLIFEIQKYDMVVDEDQLPEAKKLMAELNKVKGAIQGKIKEAIAELNLPIDELKEKMKELSSICDDGRTKIKEQVEVFEKKRLEICEQLVATTIEGLRKSWKISERFWKTQVSQFVMISFLTKNDALTKTAEEKIKSAIETEKFLHSRHEHRKDQCYRWATESGVEPFTEATINQYIEIDDDDAFRESMGRIIQQEVDRLAKIKAKAEEEERRKSEERERQIERDRIREIERIKAEEEGKRRAEEDRIRREEELKRIEERQKIQAEEDAKREAEREYIAEQNRIKAQKDAEERERQRQLDEVRIKRETEERLNREREAEEQKAKNDLNIIVSLVQEALDAFIENGFTIDQANKVCQLVYEGKIPNVVFKFK